jgi:hypothetical protein
MPVNNSLLNPPSEVEKMRDLGSNSERMMCSYVRLRTRRSDAWQRCASGCLKSWRNPQKGHTRRSKMLIPMMLQHITAVNWASCNDDGGFGKRDRGFRIRAERGTESDHMLRRTIVTDAQRGRVGEHPILDSSSSPQQQCGARRRGGQKERKFLIILCRLADALTSRLSSCNPALRYRRATFSSRTPIFRLLLLYFVILHRSHIIFHVFGLPR